MTCDCLLYSFVTLLRELVPLLSYLFLVFVFFHTPNLKRSFNLF